jgi:Raf kinase inhibitor-like YbhB/YbcL family protein
MTEMTRLRSLFVACIAVVLLAAACSSDDGGSPASQTNAGGDPTAEEYALTQQVDLTIAVTSTQFNETRRIPRKYSCTHEGMSVPISWGDVPEGTVSLALLVESNQAPGTLWVHWLLWGIPPDLRALPEAVPNAPDAPDVGPNAVQGTNTDSKLGWSGPCPPAVVVDASVMKGRSGYLPAAVHDHSVSQYYFRLYALDIDLQLDPSATKEAFLKAIDGHVLAGGELVGEQIASPTKMRPS